MIVLDKLRFPHGVLAGGHDVNLKALMALLVAAEVTDIGNSEHDIEGSGRIDGFGC